MNTQLVARTIWYFTQQRCCVFCTTSTEAPALYARSDHETLQLADGLYGYELSELQIELLP